MEAALTHTSLGAALTGSNDLTWQPLYTRLLWC